MIKGLSDLEIINNNNDIIKKKINNFKIIQEKLKDNFNENFDYFNQIKEDDTKIILETHNKLKEIFNINEKNIELFNNKELKNILTELYNKCMIILLRNKNINDKNINDKKNIINYYNIYQKEQEILYIRKNKDYGDAYLLFGIIGIIIRIQDKLQRLISILNNKKIEINDETIFDTLIDLTNYSILALILYK